MTAIPELLDMVLSNVDDTRAMVNLSTVNHDFEDAASSIIWRELDSLNPLLRLLPGEFWDSDQSFDVRWVSLSGIWSTLIDLHDADTPTAQSTCDDS